MMVTPQGVSIMAAGLDGWFRSDTGADDERFINIDEFRVEEWRLERALGVSHFRLPPDYRRSGRNRGLNEGLTIPFVRFPTWHRCRKCNALRSLPTSVRGRVSCEACRSAGRKPPFMTQVSNVAMCRDGHIQDFPYVEWVHRSLAPECRGPLRLYATGAATAANEKVKCDSCGKERTMAGVLQTLDGEGGRTHLSEFLAGGSARYVCRGLAPWNGPGAAYGCGLDLRGALRGASNVYFPLVMSSIYLPRASEEAPSDLLQMLREPPISTFISALRSAAAAITPELTRRQYPHALSRFTDHQLEVALEVVTSDELTGTAPVEEDETAFRRQEWEVLSHPRDAAQLVVRAPEMDDYGKSITRRFSRVMLVERLRETRALWGFNRLIAETAASKQDRMKLLRREIPQSEEDLWLPAYTVHGEGILLELNAGLVRDWEAQDAVRQRVARLDGRHAAIRAERGLPAKRLSPRMIAIHTLAHLLINRLAFACGYSAASLRERLFAADEPDGMAGLLIYTADGDSEGTLGGLVRMGRPGWLEPIISGAIDDASWCSGDPVCMEIGGRSGQGPDSCNLAACYRCALVAETSCELQNRFLDRGLLVGADDGTPGLLSDHSTEGGHEHEPRLRP
jgi:ssDNA-binding Zn-finger/Zn-ribbon topoisomerase 1